jgi:putative restriction endonuclease
MSAKSRFVECRSRLLAAGFVFEGTRVPLLGPRGIFKPAVCELPLSITTVPLVAGKQPPYPDHLSGAMLSYSYRGQDPRHRDNAGLRRALELRVPLIYFFGTVPGQYLPAWPVFVVADNPASLTFSVQVDEAAVLAAEPGLVLRDEDARRSYQTRITLQRMHQATFRQRVLRAYQLTCAVCQLRHAELLDAAHILPDGHPHGEPIVPNGLALCKLHHAAFDSNIIGIRPDLILEVRADILDEIDGPMLQHGLKGMHGQRIRVPQRVALQPRPEFLDERFELFRRAG